MRYDRAIVNTSDDIIIVPARLAKMCNQKVTILRLQVHTCMNAKLVHLVSSDFAYSEEFLDRQLFNKLYSLMRFDYCYAIWLFKIGAYFS